jgi:hypothetical protein
MTPLDDAVLTAWRQYLEFEEKQTLSPRARKLYERCVLTCVRTDDFDTYRHVIDTCH